VSVSLIIISTCHTQAGMKTGKTSSCLHTLLVAVAGVAVAVCVIVFVGVVVVLVVVVVVVVMFKLLHLAEI